MYLDIPYTASLLVTCRPSDFISSLVFLRWTHFPRFPRLFFFFFSPLPKKIMLHLNLLAWDDDCRLWGRKGIKVKDIFQGKETRGRKREEGRTEATHEGCSLSLSIFIVILLDFFLAVFHFKILNIQDSTSRRTSGRLAHDSGRENEKKEKKKRPTGKETTSSPLLLFNYRLQLYLFCDR